MKIKKGDNTLVIAGKDKGRKGKVLRIFPDSKKIMVENINMIKKHLKPRRSGKKGQKISIPAPLHISNVKLVCPKCSKATRVGWSLEEGKKFRICKKCKAKI